MHAYMQQCCEDLIFCFPLDWYINRKNAKRCEEWTFKMEVLGQKIALHGTDYFHVDRAQRNEYSLYRADGELTDQPAMCRHEADEGTKIYKNDVSFVLCVYHQLVIES